MGGSRSQQKYSTANCHTQYPYVNPRWLQAEQHDVGFLQPRGHKHASTAIILQVSLPHRSRSSSNGCNRCNRCSLSCRRIKSSGSTAELQQSWRPHLQKQERKSSSSEVVGSSGAVLFTRDSNGFTDAIDDAGTTSTIPVAGSSMEVPFFIVSPFFLLSACCKRSCLCIFFLV